ncbi:MAG: radical SAM protein [Campylobacterota bacterium]|nr:radical SAM protein [Campylobacterota bacterium]
MIRPNMGNYRAKDALTPLAMGIIAALTPDDIEVTFYDDRIEEIPPDDMPDMVALSVETFTAKRSYDIAGSYREKGILVVMGGYHPTLLPDEVLKHADVVVMGDAEGVWEEILKDFENKSLRSIYSGGNQRSLSEYKIDRSIFKGKRYLPVELIQFSRGCRYSCDFCSIDSFYLHTVRLRPVESIVAEIKTLNRKQLIFFVDDNLYSSKESLYKLLDAIGPLKIRWSCQISIDVARDEELLDRIVASGCVIVLIGFESLVDENLKQMGKNWNKKSGDYLEVIKKFHNRGVAVYGTFIFGYDNDTLEVIKESVSFAKSAKLEIANFNPLTPTPGTELYKRLEEEGRLIYKQWWIDPDYHYGDPIFNTALIDPDTFSKSCFDARKSFYSWGSIFDRIIFSKLLFKPFQFLMILIVNVVSKKEVISKQSRVLGES